MPAEYVPTLTDGDVLNAVLCARTPTFIAQATRKIAFDRWLADHDATIRAEARAEVAREIETWANQDGLNHTYVLGLEDAARIAEGRG